MTARTWVIAPHFSDDLVSQLLHNRGVVDPEKFFNPSLGDFSKEINLAEITKAKTRIEKAIKDQELIVVYGDYDVDGVCASAVLYHGLTKLGAKVLPYIPHREKEGYGLSKGGLDNVKAQGAAVVISVDCGIVAFEPARYAKKLGLDLIITDHHQLAEEKPEAFCIIHSTQICGAAVAWCLLRQLIPETDAAELLDFVGIATVCDMMPLTGVNRFFVKRGLELLNKTNRVGWRALFSECSITPGNLKVFDIGFIIGPRLNAVGRLSHALDALRLLCTQDLFKAQKLAQTLCLANDERKKLTLEAVEEAKLMVPQPLNSKLIILNSKHWVPGIIGLVAGRITEEFGVATIAIYEGEEVSKGSARSSNGLNIVETIRTASSLLVDVGGHEAAAGFTIQTTKISEFKEFMDGLDFSQLNLTQPTLNIDAQVTLTQLTKKLAKELEQFEPCGLANPQPLFVSQAVRVDEVKAVGNGKHLKLVLDGIGAIAFGRGELATLIKPGSLVDVAYNLEIDQFNGGEKLQLKIKDIKIN